MQSNSDLRNEAPEALTSDIVYPMAGALLGRTTWLIATWSYAFRLLIVPVQ